MNSFFIRKKNSFLNGEAKDLNDAFNQIKNKELDKELWNYYDDVQDIKIGNFEPTLKDRKTKHGIYIGKLNLSLDFYSRTLLCSFLYNFKSFIHGLLF